MGGFFLINFIERADQSVYGAFNAFGNIVIGDLKIDTQMLMLYSVYIKQSAVNL